MKYPLFSVTGLEVEHMIVLKDTLQIADLAPSILGTPENPQNADVDRGPIAWSNELVNHVIEMKTTQPVASLWDVEPDFQHSITEINTALLSRNAMLLSTGMHPTMDSQREGTLWCGDDGEIYAEYEKIFDCHQHGWKNVQSIHLNLPFDSDEAFGALHAAVRVLLPIIPALSAASPYVNGKLSAAVDARLFAYKDHQTLLPITMGEVIPEPIFTEDEYRTSILQPIAAAVEPYNKSGILQPQFMNARGAIARFDRSAIEIRVIDAQECMQANIGLTEIVVAAVQALVTELWSTAVCQRTIHTATLATILWQVAEKGELALIQNEEFLHLFDIQQPCTAGEIWHTIIERFATSLPQRTQEFASLYKTRGSLGTSILRASTETNLVHAYTRVAECLSLNTFFTHE